MKRASVVVLLFSIAATHVGGALVGHALQRGELGEAELVEVGRRVHDAGVDQLVDELVAQALDVERAAAREVQQRLLALRRAHEPAACSARSPRRAAARSPSRIPDSASASRTRAHRAAAARAARARPAGSRRRRAARSTVSPMRRSWRRISSSLCSVTLVTVVPPTNTGCKPRDRRDRAGAADLHVDGEELGRHLLRRELVRDRPARLARAKAELALQREAVDLVHDAVDLERQIGAPRLHVLVERGELRRRRARRGGRR